MFPSTSTSSTKFLTHFRNLQTGDDKPGASETLAYLNGDLSFEEFEKYVRDSNTDFSFINVGKSLEAKDPKEPVKIDLDELIDELSDISDLSGFSSTAEESSNDDDNDKNTSLLKNTRNNKTKRKKIEIDDSDEESSNQNSNDKNSDTRKRQKKVSNTSSTDLRDRIVQHLEQIELEKKKKKRGRKKNNRQSSTTQAAHLKSTKVSDKTPRSRLTQEYQSLMGEANMAYAHGDVEKAVKICQEVILKAPHASEPYMTIATIYEDQNDLEKAFEMNFIAAHCLRKKEFWLQMLGECQKRKRQDLIGTCLTNIVKLDPTDISMHLKRIQHIEQYGIRKQYISSLNSLLLALNPTENEEQKPLYLEKYRILIQEILVSDQKETELQDLLYKGLHDLGKDFPIEYIERLLHVQYNMKSYPEMIKNMINFTGIHLLKYDTELELPVDITDLDNLKDADFLVPDFYRTDYFGMFLVGIIDMGCMTIALRLLPSYISIIRSTDQQLCLDLMSSFSSHGQLQYACQLFEHLSCLTKLSAQAWFSYSEWLTSLSKLHEAYDALERTLQLDPQHNEARLSLSALQKQIGLDEQSRHTFSELVRPKSEYFTQNIHDEDDDEDDDDVTIHQQNELTTTTTTSTLLLNDDDQDITVEKIHFLTERCITLYDDNELSSFIPSAMQLFFGSLKFLLNIDISKRLINCGTRARRLELIQKLVDEKRIILNTSFTRINVILKNRIIDLYGKFCDVLIKIKRYDLLLQVSAAGTVIPLLYARIDWLILTEFILFISLILQQNGDLAFQTCREIFRYYSKSSVIQNLFALTSTITPSIRIHKFCIRSLQKNPHSKILQYILGNFALIGGTYRLAIIYYMKLYKTIPNEPLVSLLLSITFAHITCQKYSYNKHQRVLHSLTFLKQYRNLRGECTETFYNIGRLMHFLSLYHAAAYFYHKCLETSSPVENENYEQNDVFTLKYHAAYNLALIYKRSNNEKFARNIIRTYMTI